MLIITYNRHIKPSDPCKWAKDTKLTLLIICCLFNILPPTVLLSILFLFVFSWLLPLPASQLGGEFAQQVGRCPGPGMGQWAGVVGRCGRSWRSMWGRPTVPNLPSMKSAPHCWSPGEAGRGCGGWRGGSRGASDAMGWGGGRGKAVGQGAGERKGGKWWW